MPARLALYVAMPITLPINAQVSAESMEVPDLPANYVMDEFVKAREKARMPKKGSVKTAAGVWYDEHHD